MNTNNKEGAKAEIDVILKGNTTAEWIYDFNKFLIDERTTGEIIKFVDELLHQELQKARESERERIIAEIDNMKGYAVSLPEIDASLGELSSEDIEFTVQPFAQIIFKAEVIKALT